MNQVLKGFITLLIAMALVGTSIVVSPSKVLAANSASNNNLTTTQTKSNTSVSIISSPAIMASQKSNQTKINVVASFFPIYEFVKAVGGDRIDASVKIMSLPYFL
ncbi:MAG: hypothetical protein WCF23_01740 [Candidatus Nitrosopolaris sp.]